jgi:hypothetical protein
MQNGRTERVSGRTGLCARPTVGSGVRRLAVVLLAPVVAVLAGCSGKGQVSGKVTYKGQPVPAGRVTFVCQSGDNRSISAAIKDGRYTIADCPSGPVKISVETFPPAGAAKPDASPPGAPKGITAGFGPSANSESYASPPGQYVQLPARFANPDKSDLSYTVTAGKQDHDLDLGN